MANFCKNCGLPLREGAKFCENCGAPINDLATAEPGSDSECKRFEEPARSERGSRYEPDKDFQSMFLRYDNRLNRKRYIMRSLAVFFGMLAINAAIGTIGALMKSGSFSFLGSVFSLASALINCMLTIRRLHDLNRPTWWCIGIIIPLVNIALAVYLLCFKGTDGPNDYGPDPLE